MKRIQLWAIDQQGATANLIETVASTATEALLEDVLVKSPALLGQGISLVARQLPTSGGPLDLLGVDEDGRLIVFELKRGTLTRDAVAQVVDYASDLAEQSPEDIARLVQDYSGRLGVEKIEDFEDWYGENFPNSKGVLSEPPLLVLVGLGVDPRALRMVNYLANAGVRIELLTYHAFSSGGQVILARHVESAAPGRGQASPNTAPTKIANLRALQDNARSLGVLDLLESAAEFVKEMMPAYQWPGKTAYSFSLPEKTGEGNPTLRTYVRLDISSRHPGTVTLTLNRRALEAAQSAAQIFRDQHAAQCVFNDRHSELGIRLSGSFLVSAQSAIRDLLGAIAHGAKAKVTLDPALPIEEQDLTSEPTLS